MENLVICKNCGVKFEGQKISCPVCRYNQEKNEIEYSDKIEEKIIKRGWKNLLLYTLFFAILIPCFTVLAIDFTQNSKLTWSLLVIIPLISSWVYLFLLLKTHRHPFVLVLLLTLVTITSLYLLNMLQRADWFVSFGLPLSIGIPVISYIIIRAMNKVRNNIPSTVALFIFGLALIAVFIEITFSFSSYHHIRLTWSFVVLGSVIPIVLMLLYLGKHKHVLERWFHL